MAQIPHNNVEYQAEMPVKCGEPRDNYQLFEIILRFNRIILGC